MNPSQAPHMYSSNHIFDFANRTIFRHVIENVIGFSVRDLSLYTEALTHKSAIPWYQLSQSYERLEFIGDSVLGLVTTRFLFETFYAEQEGFLTRLRTKIVSGKKLCEFAREIHLQGIILMDTKALENRWNENDRILEDVFEALIGAIYLDLGLECAKRFLSRFLGKLDFEELLTDRNYKDIVMRYCQSIPCDLPAYNLVHQSTNWFEVELYLQDQFGGRGSGSTKKAAEQEAALDTIRNLNIDPSSLKRK